MKTVALIAALLLAPETHTGTLKTAHFTIRYRPGSRAGASVERTAAMAERELAHICKVLEIENDGQYVLRLYDGLPELHAITKTSGNAGFSAVDTMHIPYDNDQTRLHEMVHVVAYRLPKTGEEPRSLFFAEGLANAILVHVHGVPVHAVAKFARKHKRLPKLAVMTGGDFYAWISRTRRGDAYDIAASWILYLLDTHGAAKVKRYYTGTPAQDAFGEPLAKLERAWHKALDAFVLRPEVETLLKKRGGEAAAFDVYPLTADARLPKELLGKPSDWKDITGQKLKGDGWTRGPEGISGKSADANWVTCTLGTAKYKNCAVRAKVKATAVGVQLRLGPKFQGMFTNAGAFVFGASFVAGNREEKFAGGREIDLLVVRRNGNMEVWVDGFLLVKGKADAGKALAGIGVAGGTATFREVRVRKLK